MKSKSGEVSDFSLNGQKLVSSELLIITPHLLLNPFRDLGLACPRRQA